MRTRRLVTRPVGAFAVMSGPFTRFDTGMYRIRRRIERAGSHGPTANDDERRRTTATPWIEQIFE
ncbi:hypothetical protein SLI_7521 [Streptomyces lividans 1326]|uniref:Uncharacterized protein n=1 Tax=Streptomyces lividans 1326 TaxID=1200984 RepID=A0A7U9HFD4_STRLI|nr:hypothetical protein SLI_7521 [Streptomyces lividans 1326]